MLYDTTGPVAHTAQTTAAIAATLAGHFGTVTTQPIVAYTPGRMAEFDQTIYIGTTFREPLPAAFLAEAGSPTAPLTWAAENIGALFAVTPELGDQLGWSVGGVSHEPVDTVRYRGFDLVRQADDPAGLTEIIVTDPTKATTLALAVVATPDGSADSTFPWAVRSGNLTYIAENPISFSSEGGRYLAFADLLAPPDAPERHRALVRLEDVTPNYDPDVLRTFTDYLASRNTPFTIGVIPEFRDPIEGGTTVKMQDRPDFIAALRHAQANGGTLTMHGYTHQLDDLPNPYNGRTSNDYEFMRMTLDEHGNPAIVGPPPDDSSTWVLDRLDAGINAFLAAGLERPKIFEFPHYLATITAYAASAERFNTRYERVTYLPGVLGGPPSYDSENTAMLPYVGTDVWGVRIIPENLGFVTPGSREPADVLEAAARTKAVRDGVASFFYHPFLGLEGLATIVEGMQADGWTFVAPDEL